MAAIGRLFGHGNDSEVEISVREKESRWIKGENARVDGIAERVELVAKVNPALRGVIRAWQDMMVRQQQPRRDHEAGGSADNLTLAIPHFDPRDRVSRAHATLEIVHVQLIGARHQAIDRELSRVRAFA